MKPFCPDASLRYGMGSTTISTRVSHVTTPESTTRWFVWCRRWCWERGVTGPKENKGDGDPEDRSEKSEVVEADEVDDDLSGRESIVDNQLWCEQFGEELDGRFADSIEELGKELEEDQGQRKEVEREDDFWEERKIAESKEDIVERWTSVDFGEPEGRVLNKRHHGG